MPTIAEDTKK
jgi:hypothetical protein